MTERSDVAAKRIVVGVDGSERSIAALRWASRIASATGCGIDAMIAWEYPAAYGWVMAPEGWPLEDDAAAALQRTLDEAFGQHRPADLRAICRHGSARTLLLNASKDAEMLIVGSRGHGGFAGLLLGSVSAACAEHAACPVLVVHGDSSPNSEESVS
ncbi:MAG TPA: universal stress protein [Acidothermaceae bacterium]|nr:universal stress protein [Acidothermaceae bacterium]